MPVGPAPVSSANDSGSPSVGSSRVIIVNKPDDYGTPTEAGLQWSPYSPASFEVVKLTATTTLVQNPPLVVRCDATSGNITVTLPSAAATNSNIWHISKTNTANTVTISIDAADTWYGDTAAQTLSAQWDSVTLISVSDPINAILGWHVIATT